MTQPFSSFSFKCDLFREQVSWLETGKEKNSPKSRKKFQPPDLSLRSCVRKVSSKMKRYQRTTSWQLCWGSNKDSVSEMVVQNDQANGNSTKTSLRAKHSTEATEKNYKPPKCHKFQTMVILGLPRPGLRTIVLSPQ